MSSPLLLLPSELKNKIFEFALSEADGLDLVVDLEGTQWLRLHQPYMAVEDGDDPIDEPRRDEIAILTFGTTGMYNVNGGRVIANQLQFVCYQLRHETKALGIIFAKPCHRIYGKSMPLRVACISTTTNISYRPFPDNL
jgi:hypothetical protein